MSYNKKIELHYATYYDQEQKKFITIEVDESTKAKYLENSIEHDTFLQFAELQFAVQCTQKFNKCIEQESKPDHFKVFICKDCKRSFTMDMKLMDWYKDKGYKLPKRCPECRKKHKEEKNKTVSKK